MTIGRPREAHVQRDMRECEIHGNVEHARRSTGLDGGVRYSCMCCEADRTKKYHADVRAGVREPKPRNAPETKKPTCGTCYVELPATKICDNCD